MTVPSLLLDTNAIWMDKQNHERLTRACQAGKLRVYLPALVLVERERQLLQHGYILYRQGKTHDVRRGVLLFRQWVQDLARELVAGELQYQPILAFDQEQAQLVSFSWQEWLAAQPDSYVVEKLNSESAVQAWRERCKDKHPVLADLDWLLHKADWSIAAVARRTGWPIVTNDDDPPFRQPGVITFTLSEFIAQYLTEVD